MSEYFDPEEVLEQIGGDVDLLKEIIEIFLSVYPEDLQAIREAIDSKDTEEIRSAAHRMKGSVSNFGKRRAFQAAKDLEECAREKNISHVDEHFTRLSDELVSLDRALRDYCST